MCICTTLAILQFISLILFVQKENAKLEKKSSMIFSNSDKELINLSQLVALDIQSSCRYMIELKFLCFFLLNIPFFIQIAKPSFNL